MKRIGIISKKAVKPVSTEAETAKDYSDITKAQIIAEIEASGIGLTHEQKRMNKQALIDILECLEA